MEVVRAVEANPEGVAVNLAAEANLVEDSPGVVFLAEVETADEAVDGVDGGTEAISTHTCSMRSLDPKREIG